MRAGMFVLFTDFGLEGPYIGQMQAVLHDKAPGIPVVNLVADLPSFDIQAAARLLPAYATGLQVGSVVLCIVDPGVGGERDCLAVRTGGSWYLAPDEGLLEYLLRRADKFECYRLPLPGRASPSFHGRDVFAPAAAFIARNGSLPQGCAGITPARMPDWPDDLWRVLYTDRFGNAVTGLSAGCIDRGAVLSVAGRTLHNAETFSSVAEGEAFWYVNSSGLVEIAVNRGRASELPGVTTGSEVTCSQ